MMTYINIYIYILNIKFLNTKKESKQDLFHFNHFV